MRDDFGAPIKEHLARRAGGRCSNQGCKKGTFGPHSLPTLSVNIGVAAHITAASPGGPRYDSKITQEERASISNAIWLCQNCAKLIDSDPERFTVAMLQQWKRQAEIEVQKEIETPLAWETQADNQTVDTFNVSKPTTAQYPLGPNCVSLRVVHKDDPPGSFEYVLTDFGIVKAYSSRALRLYLLATLNGQLPTDIYSLVVETVAYSRNLKRILTLTKPKGLYTPEKLQVSLKTTPGERADLLGERSWKLERPGTEVLSLEITPKPCPGLYLLRFSARYSTRDEAERRADSETIALFVDGPEFDNVELKCRGRHYDGGAYAVLESDETVWTMLKAESRREDSLVFLGPSYYETAREILDTTWLVRRYKAPLLPDGSRSPNTRTPSPVIWDSGVKVEEELYSEREAIGRCLGLSSDDSTPEKVAELLEKVAGALAKNSPNDTVIMKGLAQSGKLNFASNTVASAPLSRSERRSAQAQARKRHRTK